MNNINLLADHYNDLAELLITTHITSIPIKPIEAKVLFDLEQSPNEIKEFKWNIHGNFIKGKISEETVIYSPRYLVQKTHLDKRTWHPHPMIASILEFMGNYFSHQEILEKLQEIFYQEFEYLSLGQAKSVIKRQINITLSSAERNDIYRLRKKLDGYRKMLVAFDGMLDKQSGRTIQYEQSIEDQSKSAEELITKSEDQLKFMCWECKTYVEIPKTTEVISPPSHHNKPMTLNWGGRIYAEDMSQLEQEIQHAIKKGREELAKPKEEGQSLSDIPYEVREKLKEYWGGRLSTEDKSQLEQEIQHLIEKDRDVLAKSKEEGQSLSDILNELRENLEKSKSEDDLPLDHVPEITNKTDIKHDLKLYCTICQQYFPMKEKLKNRVMNSDTKIELPSHHETEMEIRIGDRKPFENLHNPTQIKKFLRKAEYKVEPGKLYYICKECDHIKEHDKETVDKIPKHHDQPMTRIQISFKE